MKPSDAGHWMGVRKPVRDPGCGLPVLPLQSRGATSSSGSRVDVSSMARSLRRPPHDAKRWMGHAVLLDLDCRRMHGSAGRVGLGDSTRRGLCGH
jgi:hypothetical protein